MAMNGAGFPAQISDSLDEEHAARNHNGDGDIS